MALVLQDPAVSEHDLDLSTVPPAPKPARRNVMVVGALLVAAAGTALIGGLLAGYFDAREAVRAAGDPWVPDGLHMPNPALLLTYTTLLMSSVTVQWSVAAIGIGDRRQVYLSLGLTLLLGAAFVNALSFCWSELGAVAADSPFASHMYAVTVTHLIIVLAAAVTLVVVGFRALGGQITRHDREPMVAAAVIWHFAVAAGFVVWWSIWFLEGGP